MEPEAFLAAHFEYRIRAGFRLAGVLASVLTAFWLSLASLQAYYTEVPVIIPIPFVLGWALGYFVAYAARIDARTPRIPRARALRRNLAR